MQRTPKVLFWDIETTDMELAIRSYGLKNYIKYFNHKDIIRDWTMLGVAWKWQHEDTAKAISVNAGDPLDDEGIVRIMYKVLEEADVIVGHNSDKFDLKKFNTRALKYGLPPLHITTRQTVDTLKIARKYFALTSNTLSYIADFLGVDAKDNAPDWKACIEGDEDALRYMRKYNKQDVFVTEKVYNILRGYETNHPNLDVIADTRDSAGDKVDVCKVCLSPNLVKNGYMITKKGKRLRLRCKCCGSTQQGKLIRVTDIG